MNRLYFAYKYCIICCLGLFMLSISARAQHTNEPCATEIIHNKLLLTKPGYAAKIKANESILQQSIQQNAAGNRSQTATYKVPLVVHVLHLGEPIGTGTNISDAQIYSAIESLNKAYRKESGSIYDGNGVDTDIEFCLASKDPSGNPTTGINRINATGTADYENIGINSDSNEVQLKALSFWDNTQYYNIWVVSEIDDNNGGAGVQGYAYYPPGGVFTEDGTVVLHNAFGFDPTLSLGFNLKSYTNLNITLIHELGHGLDVYHTFREDVNGTTCPPNNSGQCANEGDYVCDTPPHIRSASNCLSDATPNACVSGSTVGEHQHNYMDYSSDACQNMFTGGQASRMTAALSSLRSSLVTPSNLVACGCAAASISITQTAGNNPICAGQTVSFAAIPSNGGTSPSYQWYIDNTPLSGETGITFTSSSLTGGEIKCALIMSSPADTIYSDSIVLTTNPIVTPIIYTAQTQGTSTACTGDYLTFFATGINGGTNPTFQWKINGNNVGTDTTEHSTYLPAGTSVITCEFTSNANCAVPTTVTSSSITVNVSPGPIINYVSDQNICGGNTSETFFSTTPSGASYQWTNSNTSIGLAANGIGNVPSFYATNNGLTAVTATISVSASLNNGCQGTPSTYVITVNPTPNILLNGDQMTTFNVGSSYQWFLNNQPIPGATSSSYTPTEQGNYSILIGGNPCPSNVISNTTASIGDEKNGFSLLLAPNPSSGIFSLTLASTSISDFTIEIRNTLGAEVYKEQLIGINGGVSKNIDLSVFGKGVYMLNISNSKTEVIKKVVVY